MQGHEHDHHHGPAQYRGEEDAIDPICGMTVKPTTAHRTSYGGREYLFCSAHCLKKFEASPSSFVEPPESDAPSVPPAGPQETATAAEPGKKTEWTCPMHPEVIRDAPGACPKCGMALEPRMVSLDQEQESPELRDMTRRFWVAVAFTVPLLAMAMSGSSRRSNGSSWRRYRHLRERSSSCCWHSRCACGRHGRFTNAPSRQ